MPEEVYEEDEMVGYDLDKQDQSGSSSGCVICIEGYAYGDGQSGDDYAEQVLSILILIFRT